MVTLIDSPRAMREWADATRADGRTIALVPTMGALHVGHLELIRSAACRADAVVVSLFVNPLQFGETADFEHYPRPIDHDLQACDDAGVEVVYAPSPNVMYPAGFATTVHVAGLTEPMEGVSRPGHFDGVTTVVTKLFNAARPHLAVFGEKDFQQLAVVRAMVADLDLGVEIVAHPTVREVDGLALSSRNRRLDPTQRAAAACIPHAISAAVEAARSPQATARDILDAARRHVADQPLATLDYVTLFDAADLTAIVDLGSARQRHRRVRIAIAARIGDVRLIDNAALIDT